MSGGNPDEPGLFGASVGAPAGEFGAQAERHWEEDSPFRGEVTDLVRGKIGRPPGARNKRDADAERWYFARGFTDPMQKLGELVSTDPRVLQAWFAENAGLDSDGKQRSAPNILEVVNMQIRAAGELMPYLHGKKPIEVVVGDERLPTLIVDLGTNQLAEGRAIGEQRALSIGAPVPATEGSEIKDLEASE